MTATTPPTPRRPTTPIEGVLFDLDGTLVDSEPLTPLAFLAVLREIGVHGVSKEALEEALSAPELRGANASLVVEHLLRTFDIAYEDELEHLVKRKRALAVDMVVKGEVDLEPLWFEGAAAAVRRLEQCLGRSHIGLCTSNLGPIAHATVKAGGLGDSFVGGRTVQEDVIDASTGLPRIKPLPDLYQLALKKLDHLPARNVAAVEDSVVGVTAAKRAGVGTVLGVLNRKDNSSVEAKEVREALLHAGADVVFDTTVAAIEYCIANSEGANNNDLDSEEAMALRGGNADNEEATAIMRAKEAVVRRYFDGVNQQDPAMLASCFAPEVELRDMCGPSTGAPRTARATDMADRCMEFLTAHPDCVVRFDQEPICDRQGKWVWCHWHETGTWSGESCGIVPRQTQLEVGGHTRFFVQEQQDEGGGEYKIEKMVVFRTFSEWELSL